MSTMSFDDMTAYLAASPAERTEIDRALDERKDEIHRLALIKKDRGSIPEREYKIAGQALGLSKRQIQRQIASLNDSPATSNGRKRFELSDRYKTVIMAYDGNVAYAHKALLEAGEELPSYSVFWRAWYDMMPRAIQAYARSGADAMTAMWIYIPFNAASRNMVWQADHFELPIDVIADGCTTAVVKPWLTLFVDDATRKVMGWALTATQGEHPGAEVVAATIANAIRIRLEHGTEVGGVPIAIRWDNDKSFTAGMVTQLGTSVGFECHAVPPYSGHMKGKIERLGRRVQEEFVMPQPGHTHGSKTRRNKNPTRNTGPLTADALRARLDLYFAEYDTSHHEGIGMTPMERWSADTEPLRRVSDERLRTALLIEPRRRKVIKRKGVSFRGCYWASAELQKHCNKMVEVHYPVVGNDFVEIYRDGKWVCTAWPVDSLTQAQQAAIWNGRGEQYREARRLQDQAIELREGANARMGDTDATPAIASMPEVDTLAPDADALFDLLGNGESGSEEGDSEGGSEGGFGDES